MFQNNSAPHKVKKALVYHSTTVPERGIICALLLGRDSPGARLKGTVGPHCQWKREGRDRGALEPSKQRMKLKRNYCKGKLGSTRLFWARRRVK